MQKCKTFSFLNVRICCFYLSCMVENEEIWGFALLVGQKKQFEEVK